MNISQNASDIVACTYRDFNRIGYSILKRAVKSIDWTLQYSMPDPNIVLDFLNQPLVKLLDHRVPFRVSKPKTNLCFNNGILNAIIVGDMDGDIESVQEIVEQSDKFNKNGEGKTTCARQ